MQEGFNSQINIIHGYSLSQCCVRFRKETKIYYQPRKITGTPQRAIRIKLRKIYKNGGRRDGMEKADILLKYG
jgi:hypothetical protein